MIDAKELEHALDAIEQMPRNEYEDLILSAARAHLATLPRWKEVEVVHWAVVDRDGSVDSSWSSREEADSRARRFGFEQVVRLTGTARVKV